MERVVSVKSLGVHRIWVRFTDGFQGEVDLSHLAGRGVFRAWDVPGVFDQVFVDPIARTVAWPGGIDLCPDVLYARMTGKALPGSDRAA